MYFALCCPPVLSSMPARYKRSELFDKYHGRCDFKGMDILAGRLARPEEIAKLAAFLASPAADYITGQIISPNGGFMTY